MLEKPDLQDEKIIACLQEHYGRLIVQVDFLSLGADLDTAVYRVIASNEIPYFLKLRSGVFDEASVTYPKFLNAQGIEQIIAPLTTKTDQLWANVDDFKVILYPFVEGSNVYEVNISEDHWREFGATLKRMHMADLPATITNHIRSETYSPQWRESVQHSLALTEDDIVADPIAMELMSFLKTKHNEILDLVGRAERYAKILQARTQELIVCHADIHAGNILIDVNDTFYIVDWDTLVLAPKERDLMYIGGSLLGGWRSPEEEIELFYQGYGQTEIDPVTLSYYRYERIVEDIAIYCQQLLLSDEGGDDRAQSLRALKSNFLPNSTIEVAYRSDQTGVND